MNAERNLINIWLLVVFVGFVRRLFLVAIIFFIYFRYVYNFNSLALVIFVIKLEFLIVLLVFDKVSFMFIKCKYFN